MLNERAVKDMANGLIGDIYKSLGSTGGFTEIGEISLRVTKRGKARLDVKVTTVADLYGNTDDY